MHRLVLFLLFLSAQNLLVDDAYVWCHALWISISARRHSAAGVAMQVDLKVPVAEGERALKQLLQRKQKIFKPKDRFESNAAIEELDLAQHVDDHFHQILDTAALESAQTVF